MAGIRITRKGRAFITDSNGNAIATSRAWPSQVQGRVPTLNEGGDPALRALPKGDVLPRLTKDAELIRHYDVDGEAYSAVLRRIEVQPGVYWVVGVYAPDSDFVGDLSSAARQQWLWTLGLALLTILIAWPLAFSATHPLAALQRQATTDALTGLRNRTSFLAQLSKDMKRQPAADGSEFGAAIIDLDGFKTVNDTFGHANGDEVLRKVSSLLKKALLSGDTVGRLGGDEFALILRGTNRRDIRLRLDAMLQLIALRPIEVDGARHVLKATAGLAFCDIQTPAEAGLEKMTTSEQRSAHLLSLADAALIGGKRLEKGRVWIGDEVEF